MRGAPRVHHVAPCRSLFFDRAAHSRSPPLLLHSRPLPTQQPAKLGPSPGGHTGRARLCLTKQAATVSAGVPLHWGKKSPNLPPLPPPHLPQGPCFTPWSPAPPSWLCASPSPSPFPSSSPLREQLLCRWPAQRATPFFQGPYSEGPRGPIINNKGPKGSPSGGGTQRALSSGAQGTASGSSSQGRGGSSQGTSGSSQGKGGGMEFRDGIRFIEIAANLTDGMFQGVYHGKTAHPPDIQSVLQRAWDAGVEKIIVTGGNLEGSREALALARTDPRLFCTVGVHPTRCSEFEDSGNPEAHLGQLLELAREGAAEGKVVAVGECGLDYDRLQFCPAEVQKKYFAMQFRVAQATGLPMFLHMRAAADDFLSIVKEHDALFVGGVVHSFTGTAPERDAILAEPKLFIGINGCSLKTQDNLEVIKGIPAERMMLETDCPYCDVRSSHAGAQFMASKWPSKKKEAFDPSALVKGRNEPCQIRQVLEVVCGARDETDAAQFAETVYVTTNKMFFERDR